jgi:hypothetical protein
MASILKPSESVTVAIATGILVWAIYDHSLPDAATMRMTSSFDDNIESGRKKAAWTAAGVLAAITLVTRDVNVLVLGGAMIGAFDWHARHANATDPDSGDLVSPAPGYGTGKTRSVA